jgi:TetR/AcrR family transcriptional regulator, transcriptional repressor of aconitase
MSKVSPQYRDARRAQIVDAARELFSRKGLAHSSMADLVAATGMSMGAIYRYFAGKDEVIAAVAEGRDGAVRGEFPGTECPGELLARLLTYVSGPDGAAHARVTAQIWGEAAVRPELAEIVRTRHTALRDYLAALIRDAHRPESAADQPAHGESDTELAEVVLAGMVGYAHLVAVGFDVGPTPFQRALGSLLPTSET